MSHLGRISVDWPKISIFFWALPRMLENERERIARRHRLREQIPDRVGVLDVTSCC